MEDGPITGTRTPSGTVRADHVAGGGHHADGLLRSVSAARENPLPPAMSDAHVRADTESGGWVGAVLSSTPEFWSTYRSIRLRLATLPLNDLERTLAEQAAAAMAESLGLAPAEAAYQGRRTALFRRERLLHEALALDLAPLRLATLVDALHVEGVEHVRGLRAGDPVLLLSLHYSLFSSLLCLWLTRLAAQQTVFHHLTILFDSGTVAPQPIPPSRVDALVAGGLGRRETTTLLDMALHKGATRDLVTRLRGGEAVLAFPDGALLAGSERDAPTVRLGHRTLSLGRGVPFLMRHARATLLPVTLRPRGDQHAIVFGEPIRARSEQDVASSIQAVVQQLIDQTVLADPGPWEGWLLLPPGG